MLQMLYDWADRKIKARRAYDQVLRELSSYSARDLADIGVNAGDIPQLATESAAAAEKAAKDISDRRLEHVLRSIGSI